MSRHIPGAPRRSHHSKLPGELRPEATNFAEPFFSDPDPCNTLLHVRSADLAAGDRRQRVARPPRLKSKLR